jgi:retron-type reverse transcriptase
MPVERRAEQKVTYENLMEEAVSPENFRQALKAVVTNDGAPGIDGIEAADLEKHLEAHWEKIRAKLLAGAYVPTPVKRVEIPKPSGGVRMLGIPTVLDRFIQQLLLQAMTPIFEQGSVTIATDFDPEEAQPTPYEPPKDLPPAVKV